LIILSIQDNLQIVKDNVKQINDLHLQSLGNIDRDGGVVPRNTTQLNELEK
jgi:t-SNARE complex subunit (syntaxin)